MEPAQNVNICKLSLQMKLPESHLAPLDLDTSQCSNDSLPPQRADDLSGNGEVELEQASEEDTIKAQ